MQLQIAADCREGQFPADSGTNSKGGTEDGTENF